MSKISMTVKQNSWSIQIEQLEDWKGILESTNSHSIQEDIETITDQISDILEEQCK